MINTTAAAAMTGRIVMAEKSSIGLGHFTQAESHLSHDMQQRARRRKEPEGSDRVIQLCEDWSRIGEHELPRHTVRILAGFGMPVHFCVHTAGGSIWPCVAR